MNGPPETLPECKKKGENPLYSQLSGRGDCYIAIFLHMGDG